MAGHKTPEEIAHAEADALLDEELDHSFPASDPPSSLLREPDEPPKPA
ncbi:MAG: hypothetical protein Q7J28_02850 [Caulobacter sp.]|nr:hypothetical protein [Caulobacter sp.]